MGRWERIVNSTIASGGIAIKKLNEIAAALSLTPTCCIWRKKNEITSNKGKPSKPGNDICFDLRIR